MSEDKARTAGVRKADRLLSGKDTAEIVKAVKTAEIDSTFRVYSKEWLFDSRHKTSEEAEALVESQYAGRLSDDDVEIREDVGARRPHAVWTRRWNVVGEFKWEDRAREFEESYQRIKPSEMRVVPRNGREEVLLQQYGILKLRS